MNENLLYCKRWGKEEWEHDQLKGGGKYTEIKLYFAFD